MVTEISVSGIIAVLSRTATALDGGQNIPDALEAVAREVVLGPDSSGEPEISAALMLVMARFKVGGLILSNCLRDWTLESERENLNEAVDQGGRATATALRAIMQRLEGQTTRR